MPPFVLEEKMESTIDSAVDDVVGSMLFAGRDAIRKYGGKDLISILDNRDVINALSDAAYEALRNVKFKNDEEE